MLFWHGSLLYKLRRFLRFSAVCHSEVNYMFSFTISIILLNKCHMYARRQVFWEKICNFTENLTIVSLNLPSNEDSSLFRGITFTWEVRSVSLDFDYGKRIANYERSWCRDLWMVQLFYLGHETRKFIKFGISLKSCIITPIEKPNMKRAESLEHDFEKTKTYFG